MEFRHELKFMVTESQLYELENRLSNFLPIDVNQQDDYYTITSIYFDNIYDSCLQENIDGKDHRSKYRIRIYGHSHSLIKLEKKEKVHLMTKKTAVAITIEECKQLLLGNYYFYEKFSKEKEKLFLEMKIKGLLPKSIVEYDRSTYVYPIGNVRITFDRNIRGTKNIHDFWNEKINELPLLEKDIHILEVKYDEFLPQFIYMLLDIESLQRTSFSKYAYSRKFDY